MDADKFRQYGDFLLGAFKSPPNEPRKEPAPPQSPMTINGYYTIKNDTTLTFFVATREPIPVVGWTTDEFTGIEGKLKIVGFSDKKGLDYNWSFDFQTNKQQTILPGNNYVTGAILYPPGQQVIVTRERTGKLKGFYFIRNKQVEVYLTQLPPDGFYKDWVIKGLPGGKVSFYSDIPGIINDKPFVASATMDTELGNDPKFVSFEDVVTTEPQVSTEFIGARVTPIAELKYDIPTGPLKGGDYARLRDLNTDLDEKKIKPEFKELNNQGFDAGAILALHAVGPQDKYVTSTDFENSEWNPKFPQYTNFAQSQRIVPLPGSKFLGETVTVELKPAEMSDLMSNMYLQCTLPAISGSYCSNVGRALIAQIDFMLNETVVETLYDDWYIIKDQLFADADEQLGLKMALNNPGRVIIPLEFFFCRRHSGGKGKRNSLSKPFFPTCATRKQNIYIRIKFHNQAWFTNSESQIEILNPALIIEEVKLSDRERIYYMNNPLRLVINRTIRESTLKFASGKANLNLTASMPVVMIAWFIRNKLYESQNRDFYDTRYDYGYSTKYMKVSVPLSFATGEVVNFVDTIKTAKITLNSIDILSTFEGGTYFSFKQPMEHGLSVPSKNIYMYSFGLSPKEYNQGGYLNFSKLNSQTSTLQLEFKPEYSSTVEADYNLHLYYYGYTVLEFQNGFARLPFL
jgi:hypothetical protein